MFHTVAESAGLRGAIVQAQLRADACVMQQSLPLVIDNFGTKIELFIEGRFAAIVCRLGCAHACMSADWVPKACTGEESRQVPIPQDRHFNDTITD